jgi:uncharacterized membrane protein YfcA
VDLTATGAGELAALACGLVAAGLVTGFLAGFLGIGGGAIVAPVLYEVFRLLGVAGTQRMHLAVGTTLAVMIPTTLRAFLAHKARGAVDMEVFRRFALPVVAGVVVGAGVARHAPETALKWVWVAFAAVMSLWLLAGAGHGRLGDELPRGGAGRWLVDAYAAGVGAISTLLSIGGAAFIAALLRLYGRPIERAVATSAGIGVLVSIPGTLGFVWAGWGAPDMPPLTLGYVNLVGIAALVPASVLAAPWGVRAAHGVPRRVLEIALAALLAAIGLRFLAGLLR